MEDGNQIYLLQPYTRFTDIPINGVVLANDPILVDWPEPQSRIELYVDTEQAVESILKANGRGDAFILSLTVNDARTISQMPQEQICLNVRDKKIGGLSGYMKRYHDPKFFAHMQAIASFQSFLQAGTDRSEYQPNDIVTVNMLGRNIPSEPGTLTSGRPCRVIHTRCITL